MQRVPVSILLTLCRLIFVMAVVWPAASLIWKCVTQGEAPTDGFTFSTRQLLLLWRSTWMALVATGGAVLLSLPAAHLVGRVGSLRRGPVAACGMLLLLLCPPTVYAFGWETLLPVEFSGEMRCVGVWMLWGWPIPAVLVGLGWSRSGRVVYEAALTDATATAAFFRVTLPLMWKYIGVSAAILFLLFFSDYGVPHICSLHVFATEILGWASSSARTIDTVWPGMLNVAVTAFVLAAIFLLWRRCAADRSVDAGESPPQRPLPLATALTIILLAIAWLLPLWALTTRLDSLGAFTDALVVYGQDLVQSIGVASLAAVLAMMMGFGLVTSRRWLGIGLVGTLAFGAVPGALVGESLIAAYNHEALWWLYDYWPIVAVGYVARFGWIGVLFALAVVTGPSPDLTAQARTDGASAAGAFVHVQLPISWGPALGGAAVFVALAVAEVAATTLVRVPGYAPISLVLIEKFHRFEDAMLVSLSLWLVAACLPGMLLMFLSLRRRGR